MDKLNVSIMEAYMDKLNASIMEAYEGYKTALDYVKGWKQEIAHVPAEDQQDPEEETTAGEDQEAPADA